jgi:cytidylate kinase
MKIMITGWLGAGDSEVASIIRDRRKLLIINSHKAIRDLIRERGETFQLFETESSSGIYDLDVLLRNKALEYLEEEDDLILEGRLGLLVCDQKFDIQSFLTANHEDRAKHVSARRGIALEKAREVVEISDKDRKHAYYKIHDRTLEPSDFDLVINTSGYSFETTAGNIENLLDSS